MSRRQSTAVAQRPETVSVTSESTVLIVEDEALVAFDLEDMLSDLGFRKITVCMSYASADAALAANTYDFAVFDLNLDGQMSFPLIAKAKAAGSNVVIASGYEPKTVGIDDASIPRIIKPYGPRDLARAIGTEA